MAKKPTPKIEAAITRFYSVVSNMMKGATPKDWHDLTDCVKSIRRSDIGFKRKAAEIVKAYKASPKIVEDFGNVMTGASPATWRTLIEYVRAIEQSPYAIRRAKAMYERQWGETSYFVGSVMNGTKMEKVSKRAKAYRMMEAAVSKAKAETQLRRLFLDGVVKFNDGSHYVGFVCGGNNGSSDWVRYLESFSQIVKSLPDAWIVEIDNDCCDDVHYALIGFRKGAGR